ncbi:MAG: ABC transporter ATP-binding protein [Clostridiales bacterium]|nr:ABC transporter ATP-binding protein [Clostridiales bacterium]
MNGNYIRSISIDWSLITPDSYLRDISALRFDGGIELDHPVTFFVGENGTGKSTLLEAVAVACGFSAEGGTINFSFSTYDSHSELYKAVKLAKGVKRPASSYFLRAESFYNVASKAEEYRDLPEELYYYGGKSFHRQSHGESFLALAQGSFQPGGLYLLDEPEAALSPQRQLTLLIEIHRLANLGAQFIIASHSPILLGIPGAQILSFDDGCIHPCDYRDTESYRITKTFVNNPEHFLEILLEE